MIRSYHLTLLFFLILALDQWSKIEIVKHFTLGETLEIIPGIFNLTLAYNKGAAFGIFAGLGDGIRESVLLITTILAFLLIGYFMRTQAGSSRWAKIGFALIVAGAIGNIIDRLRYGYVIDFLDFYYKSYHWPAFNVADSAICVGVAILVLIPQRKVAQTEAVS